MLPDGIVAVRNAMVASILVGWTFASAADGQYPAHDDVIAKFCNDAMLRDRGVSITLFADSPEELLVRELLAYPAFRSALAITNDQERALRTAASRPPAPNRRSQDAELSIDMGANPLAQLHFRTALEDILTPAQRSMLALVYLNREGLMALRRPEFAGLLGLTPDQRSQIALMARDNLQGPAVEANQALFVLQDDQHHRELDYRLFLRDTSMRLDYGIAQLLNERQRRGLSTLIQQAEEIGLGIALPDVRRIWATELYDAAKLRALCGG
jgi:PAS domain-containing protein